MALIKIKNPVPRFQDYRFNEPIDVTIDNENAAIIGPNGSGKSLLVDIMLGNIALKEGAVEITKNGAELQYNKIKYISFRDIYRLSDTKNSYYQQRWNATENEESPLVKDILNIDRYAEGISVVKMLNIEHILSKRLIFLSSGELRKMQLTKVLLTQPELLVIDNPYIGLDKESRDSVNNMLESISSNGNIQIVLVLSNPKDIPSYTTKLIAVKDKTVVGEYGYNDFAKDTSIANRLFEELNILDVTLPKREIERPAFDKAVVMNKVNVRYYSKQILKDVSWTVKFGEKWALLGKNGCGKSTLLSLVCGDNPQGYANDITLFDRKRGTGESIWDIKKNIGYLSPDVHTYYQEDIPCIDVVASGYFDTVGLYKRPNEEQKALAIEWMKVFGAEHLADNSFLKISYGEQRLVLLTRVFVKQPKLLILDEPLHGLDAGKKRIAKMAIEKYCQSDITLIYVTHYEEEIPNIVTERKVLTRPE